MPTDVRVVRAQHTVIVICALLVKLALIWHIGERIYPDVVRAINFGHLVDRGVFDVGTHAVNNKTFVGPLLWFFLYSSGRIYWIKAVNLLLFVALCVVHYRLGRLYAPRVRLAALVIVAFYVGTNRNVVAGEPDDMMSALLLSAGVLAYLNLERPFLAGLLMGFAFLFKFSAAIFIAGLGLYLMSAGRWRDVAHVAAGVLLPYLGLIVTTGYGSLYALKISVVRQRGYSTWISVWQRLFSTGALPTVVLSGFAWHRHKIPRNTLFLVLSTSYVVYMIVNRDAFAATFVMMQCLMFSSFLIAELLVGNDGSRHRLAAAGLALYVVTATVVSYVNLYRDSNPMVLVRDEFAARKMFPWNFPGWDPSRRGGR